MDYIIYHEIKPGTACPDKRLAHNRQTILAGTRFGMLTVVEEVEKVVTSSGHSHRQFKFLCERGNVVIRRINHIRERKTVSCGCYNKSQKTKHGQSHTALYKACQGMIQRCSNPKNRKYYLYGGKGIKVCDEWMDFNKFLKWSIENGYRKGLSLDRKNGFLDYEPSNCRYVDSVAQNNNTSRNHMIEAWGESKTVVEWARDSRCAVGYEAFAARIKRGWLPEKALTTKACR